MEVNAGDVSIVRRGNVISVNYAGEEFVSKLGIGLPIHGSWLWSFDRSLELEGGWEGTGRDTMGEYASMTLAYSIPGMSASDVPLLHQELKAYEDSQLIIETRLLEDISGTYVEDSFYNTTFNSPVLLFEKDFNFLTYTWGLMGAETSRDGGHFPEAITGKGIAGITPKLRLAGYSPTKDLHNTSQKPFCPLVLYDDAGATMVMSPFNHYLISPLRMIQTPSGMGVARGLHGSVGVLPQGTTTKTALVFGRDMVETMAKWGDWLLKAGEKSRDLPLDNPLLGGIGFWNCFGGYYTELFRKADENVLKELASSFQERAIPVSYFGLDLWYNYGQVGFARNYAPDDRKYPRGLQVIHGETGIPYILHMSAFESPNDYIGQYEFAVDQLSAYPVQPQLYQGLAKEFKKWGAFGIWPDFLRTQMQNSKSLRDTIGNADRWFDGLARAFDDQDMVMMMCMPTIGHYLASTRHQNIVAVRTHSDYLNHQEKQVEALRVTGQVRNFLPLQQSIRHNVLLSLLARSLGLCPSFDVFLTNRAHPGGFAEPNSEYEALLRAMSAGVIAVGDEMGFIDEEIIGRLCFPDGRTSRPDHPPLPVVSTLQSDVLAFYTTTTIGAMKWVYLALFNIGEGEAHYELDVQRLTGIGDPTVYDYFGAKVTHISTLEGYLEPAQGHHYIVMPQVRGASFLGFPDKYITVSNRQVHTIQADDQGFTASFRLPLPVLASGEGKLSDPSGVSPRGSSSGGMTRAERLYTVAVYSPLELEVKAMGAEVRRVGLRNGLRYIEFAPSPECPSLRFQPVNRSR